tara:strand:- start:790 stop:1293 length:504 start_codon:yes stop_codon:yes gene_type:complete
MTLVHHLFNVFSEQERKKILTDAKKYLTTIDDYPDQFYPGRQSKNLMPRPELQWVHDRLIKAAYRVVGRVKINRFWINETTGNKKDLSWHNHIDNQGTDYGSVYYLKSIPFYDGTLFEDQFVKAPQNSLLIFPAHLKHTAPSLPRYNPLRLKRYTMSADFKKIYFDA